MILKGLLKSLPTYTKNIRRQNIINRNTRTLSSNFVASMSSDASHEAKKQKLAKNPTILIGSDHGGFEMKEKLKSHLETCKVNFEDVGTFSTDSCDYPDIAKTLCNKLLELNTEAVGTSDSSSNCTDNQIPTESRGILVCGTGIGISIAANKVPGIRCALCHDHYTVSMSRKHNNANVLAIGGRTTGIEIAKGMVDVFLSEKFDGGRHSRRVGKME